MLAFVLALVFQQDLQGKVIGVLDGDTVEVLDENRLTHRIRMAEIDAPEKSQAFGNQAKIALSNKIMGQTVAITSKGKDRYGRTIGLVRLHMRDINLEMVEDGYAWWYKQYGHDPRFAAAEARARRNKDGLWIDPYPVAPWEFRHKPSSSSSKSSSSKSSSSGSGSKKRKK
jgi:micrococcal nuclease